MTLRSPGPWTVNYDPEEPASIWIEGPDGPIAKIEPCDRDDGNGEILSARDFADARVMAAAHEMLEALKGILSNAGGRCTAEQWRAGLDAVAKAEGRCDG